MGSRQQTQAQLVQDGSSPLRLDCRCWDCKPPPALQPGWNARFSGSLHPLVPPATAGEKKRRRHWKPGPVCSNCRAHPDRHGAGCWHRPATRSTARCCRQRPAAAGIAPGVTQCIEQRVCAVAWAASRRCRRPPSCSPCPLPASCCWRLPSGAACAMTGTKSNAASAHCASACARWWTHPGGNRSQASACASAWPVRRCTSPCASRLTTP